ncbi:hypothetical protein BDZ85DRAFT_256649 [Elsinoe ampelina]|uniref:Uncharacterized protein n=1 Tax=Elsinoe ampelina TaxID=302913 RepID=A0A6A6GM66_9PEZI|nr:hypothetical protein BDZ85DRAFT_256649 [Elsinoe ampelina]
MESPFETCPLKEWQVDLSTLLPASHRMRGDHIVSPSQSDTRVFLENELLIPRIDAIRKHLWICGRPMPPRPLHKQVLLGREITIAEEADHHCVWASDKIYLKPLPAYLLHPGFWRTHLSDPNGSGSLNDHALKMHGQSTVQGTYTASVDDLAACARGLLFSYTALIAYESDFQIAKEKFLIPEEVDWSSWRILCEEYLTNHTYQSVNPRYWYGELRMPRLNKVYKYGKGHIFRGFSSIGSPSSYDDWLRDNFAYLSLVFAFVVVVISAMQLGIATERLAGNASFQNASYGFTVFSIVSLVILSGLIVVIALCMIASNWIATKTYEKKRFEKMGVDINELSSVRR